MLPRNFPERKRERQLRAWERLRPAEMPDAPSADAEPPASIAMDRRGHRSKKRRMDKGARRGKA